MRISYLINGFNGGGAAFPVPDLIGLMRDLGHEVRVHGLMLQDGKACERLEKAGIDYNLLAGGKWNIVRSFSSLVDCLEREKPDWIWTSLTRATPSSV